MKNSNNSEKFEKKLKNIKEELENSTLPANEAYGKAQTKAGEAGNEEAKSKHEKGESFDWREIAASLSESLTIYIKKRVEKFKEGKIQPGKEETRLWEDELAKTIQNISWLSHSNDMLEEKKKKNKEQVELNEVWKKELANTLYSQKAENTNSEILSWIIIIILGIILAGLLATVIALFRKNRKLMNSSE